MIITEGVRVGKKEEKKRIRKKQAIKTRNVFKRILNFMKATKFPIQSFLFPVNRSFCDVAFYFCR